MTSRAANRRHRDGPPYVVERIKGQVGVLPNLLSYHLGFRAEMR